MNMRKFFVASLFAITVASGMGACKQQGPVERAGEEVDEAVDTLKNGGKESTSSKIDDAGDELRNGVNDAKEDLQK